MTSVAPPPPPPPPAAQGSAAQLTVSLPPNAGQAAAALSQLALDSLISGLIKPSGSAGEVLLQTSLGPLQFKAPFALPANAEATFKLVQTEPSVQLQLTHINGKPLPPNTPANRVMVLAHQMMQPAPTGTGQASPNLAGQPVGTPTGASAPATLLNLNAANAMKAFVLNIGTASPPTAGTSTQAQTAPINTIQTGIKNPATTSAAPVTGNTTILTTTSPQGQGTFQPGNHLNVRLLSVQLPGQPASQIAPTTGSPLASTVIVQGTVMGTTASQQPIIKTPQGQIALDTTAKMPDGTSVKIEVLSSNRPLSGASPAAAPVGPAPAPLTQKWPALEETLKILRDLNPGLADHVAKAMLPKPDSRLALNMLFFLKALGRGNFKNWADENAIKVLARTKPNLLGKLENDFQNLSDKAKVPTSTDWKIAFVPMQNNGQIDQIRIAQRDHKDEQNGGKEDPGVRFVIDINLSRLGELQFDGLAKDKSKRFDLIIRAKKALPGFMRKEIHDIFDHGMSVLGFEGKISFIVTSQFINVEGIHPQNASLNLGMLV
ncbi:hypothetical protein [Terasakiella pusilla]|uniref:hypothetical protein n=1 Tax=Terasakiella pusilla TaxID=64973 RepID=UPI003AA9B811